MLSVPLKPASRRVLSLAAIAISLGAVATGFQTPSLPDLEISDWGNIALPTKNRVFRVSARHTGSGTVTTQVSFYRGSVYTGNLSALHSQTVTFGPNQGLSITGPTLDTVEGDVFTVCVDSAKTVVEQNENNNCVVRVVSTSAAELSIDTADIRMTPVGANPGEPIQVSATVRNRRPVAARALVRLLQSHPNSALARPLGQMNVNVPASGSAVANWTIIRPDGDTNLFVSVDDVYPRETSYGDNIASRNVYLKTIVDTGRIYLNSSRASSYPAIGDLMGTGEPVMVFGEHLGHTASVESRLTAIQTFTDGTWKELWSKPLTPAPSRIYSPVMADIDGDGSPEIIVQVARNLTATPQGGGEIYMFALNRSGEVKWRHKWVLPRAPCITNYTAEAPALGDMNHDGVADVVYAEKEIVILDGRNGAELHRNANPGFSGCSGYQGLSAIADLDGDGRNEFIIGRGNLYVYNHDATLRWKSTGGGGDFALVDVEKDGKPEIVVPRYRTRFEMYDGVTGALKNYVVPSGWTPNDRTIAVTTSLDPNGLPSFAVSNNDAVNGTALLNSQMNVQWWKPAPVNEGMRSQDNPEHVVLADLLGQGVPQMITRSDARSFGIQDIRDGRYLMHTSIFGYGSIGGGPIVADVDGDGRAEVVLSYGGADISGVDRLPYEPRLPPVNYLIFSSEHWSKVPGSWNSIAFIPHQVDRKLAFRHDYQPWKTHNTWFQQPLRVTCDVDYDFDVDQNDISLIFAARDQKVAPGDWRDIDKDGVITVADGRACSTKCTSPNCAAINQPARILAVSPRTVYPGSTVDVTVRGEGVNFRAGQTQLNFGAGITTGPVTVIDAETAKARITVAAGLTGSRPVTVTTGAITATRGEALILSAGNRPPVVTASGQREVIWPAPVSLTGTAVDDGQPNAALTTTWQMVSGPGLVTFSNASGLSTTASFEKTGYYHLRLSASDGQYVAGADVGVTVLRGNEAPSVSAGPDVTGNQDAGIQLLGEVQDDGMPGGAAVTRMWSKVSGPGIVTFSSPSASRTMATFSQPGVYVLRLTATDTQLQATDDVTVTVNPPPAQILSVNPDSAVPGQQRLVTIKAKNTKFVNGTTEASFGAGVSVGNGAVGAFGKVTVLDDTTATVQVNVGASASLGPRTVTIRTGTESAAKVNGFHVGTIGVPHSIRLNLSDRVIAPGGSIASRPEVVDAAGNVISGAEGFTMAVTPKPNLTTGNPPEINGLTVRFPKLTRRLRNHDVTKDPLGRWTDGDRSDPNYGKETGGLYTLTVTLNSTQIRGTAEIAVLPSGTADITLLTAQYAGRLAEAAEAGRLAFVARNLNAAAAARGQIGNVLSTPEFKLSLLATNDVLAPPNGFPVTTAQLSGRFPSVPDDAKFGQLLDAHLTHVALMRARIEQINASAVTQADVDALRAAANAYRSLTDQLSAVKPGPLGVVENGRKLNQLLRSEMPKLLEAVGRKSVALITAIDGLPVVPASEKDEGFRAASSQNFAFPTDALLNIYSELFSVFTDFATYARANTYELGISLANSLVNIALANALNELAPGGLAVDFVVGGAQFSFVCPRFPNSYVEGRGFSSNLEENSVAVIGCLNSNALRTMLTMSPVTDKAAAIRLMFDIKGLAEAFAGDGGIAATAEPDFLRDGWFGGTQMVFRQGWPKVNQGRIPCVGVFIAFNLETGSFHSTNTNMLPACE